jgi:pimeloyl-ACP methyl ester carboxylesterase
MANPACLDHNPPRTSGTLVCLPGVNSGAYIFESALKPLGQSWRIVRMNLPGVDGVPLILPFTTKSYARFAWDVLDGMNISGPITLMGHSMGGFAVQEMIRMRPSRINRAVLISTRRGQPDMTTDLNAMHKTLGKSFWQIAQEIEKKPESGMRSLFGQRFLASSPATYTDFIRAREAHLPSSAARMAHLTAGGAFSSVGWAYKITCPTLVVHGTDDILVRAISGRKLAQSLPNGRWLELFGVGHFPMLENETFWQYVGDFLSGSSMGISLEAREHPLWRKLKDFLFSHG